MSKAKLLAAREFIQEKRYAEARTLLESMPDDPTAQKWLAKLNKIATPARRPRFVTPPPPPAYNYSPAVVMPYEEKKRTSPVLIGLLVISLLFVAIVVYAFIRQGQLNSGQGTASARLFGYCLDIESRYDGDIESCSEWTDTVFEPFNEKIMACHRLSPELDAPFEECLIDEEILPPGIIRNR